MTEDDTDFEIETRQWYWKMHFTAKGSNIITKQFTIHKEIDKTDQDNFVVQ